MGTTTLSGRRSQIEAQIASLRAEGESLTRMSTLTPAQEARALQIPGELTQARSDLAEEWLWEHSVAEAEQPQSRPDIP